MLVCIHVMSVSFGNSSAFIFAIMECYLDLVFYVGGDYIVYQWDFKESVIMVLNPGIFPINGHARYVIYGE